MSVTVGKVRVYEPWLTAGETRSNDFTKYLSGRAPCAVVFLCLSSPPSRVSRLIRFFPRHARLCRRITRVRASRVRVAAPLAVHTSSPRMRGASTSLAPTRSSLFSPFFSRLSGGEMSGGPTAAQRRCYTPLLAAAERERERERERENEEEEESERPAKNH